MRSHHRAKFESCRLTQAAGWPVRQATLSNAWSRAPTQTACHTRLNLLLGQHVSLSLSLSPVSYTHLTLPTTASV